MKLIIGSLFMALAVAQTSSVTIPVTGLTPDANGNITITLNVKLGTVVTSPITPPYNCGWTDTTPVFEPVPTPTLNVGQIYKNVFGCDVVRLTQEGTTSHFYSDVPPLDKSNTFIILNGAGGSTLISELNADGTRKNGPLNLSTDLGGPYYLSMYRWDPNRNGILYVIAGGKQLWKYNAVERTWTMIYDLNGLLPTAWPTTGSLKLHYADGDKFIMDYSEVNKVAFGTVILERQSNGFLTLSINDSLPSRQMLNGSPDRGNLLFAGISSVAKNGSKVLLQFNGVPIDPWSPDPAQRASTMTYVQPYKPFNYFILGRSISGKHAMYHNATGLNNNCRVFSEEIGEYDGFVNGAPNWLNQLACVNLGDEQNPSDNLRITPVRYVFKWPYSLNMSGAHVSYGPFDATVALSLYQESTEARATKAYAHEIIVVDANKFTNITKRRVAQHFTKSAPDYWQTPRASYSMDGKWIVFTSSWGRTDDKYDVFMVRVN